MKGRSVETPGVPEIDHSEWTDGMTLSRSKLAPPAECQRAYLFLETNNQDIYTSKHTRSLHSKKKEGHNCSVRFFPFDTV